MLASLRTQPRTAPAFSPSPGWVRSTALAEDAENAAFFADAALSMIHPIAVNEHPLGILWRQRLAPTRPAAGCCEPGECSSSLTECSPIHPTELLQISLDDALQTVIGVAASVSATSLRRRDMKALEDARLFSKEEPPVDEIRA